jgi:hypothetical protein
MKLEVKTVVRVASPFHSLLVSSFFLLPPFLFCFSRSSFVTFFLCCHVFPLIAFFFLKVSLSHPFFHVFFLLSFSLTTFLFPCLSHIRVIHFISRLLDEVELNKQCIEDMVNMNTRRYQGEVTHLTLRQ